MFPRHGSHMTRTPAHQLLIAAFLVAVSLSAVALDRHVLRPLPEGHEQVAQRTLVHPGPEAGTRLVPGFGPEARARAEAALEGSGWFGAYAEGADLRRGAWPGAHSAEVARRYALAACGPGCAIVAERHPLHNPGPLGAEELLLTAEIARRVGREWPYVSNNHALALGGAGAWGTGHSGGRSGWRTAVRLAVEECEARRAAEPTPEGIAAAPCIYMALRDMKVEDRRPERPLYPAPYVVAHARLVRVPEDAMHLVRPDGTGVPGASRVTLPNELYGACARNGAGAEGIVRLGGWPGAATELAIALCETERRFGTPECTLRSTRLPRAPVPDGALAVDPELHEAFRWWQETRGAGAFAISALGVWGMSYNLDDPEEARQRAADRCAYHTGRGNRAMDLSLAFIEQPACRIVAERPPG